MMHTTEVKKLVDRMLPRLQDLLQLHGWSIEVDYCRLDCAGQCSVRSTYHRALVELDPDRMEDEKEVFWVLLHELLHIHQAPFDKFRHVLLEHVPRGNPEGAMRELWLQVCEEFVLNMETMLTKGVVITPSKYLKP